MDNVINTVLLELDSNLKAQGMPAQNRVREMLQECCLVATLIIELKVKGQIGAIIKRKGLRIQGLKVAEMCQAIFSIQRLQQAYHQRMRTFTSNRTTFLIRQLKPRLK